MKPQRGLALFPLFIRAETMRGLAVAASSKKKVAAAVPQGDSQEDQLTVHLMGAPAWRVGGGEPLALSGKDAALLAKLALDGPQPRHTLCELLWPDSTPEKAAASLRQRASRLRAAAGVPFVELGATTSLHPGVIVDVCQIERLGEDKLLTSPELLAGLDFGDQDDLDRWLADARRRVAERCASRLAEHADALEQRGHLAEAVAMARRAVEWMPLAEQGWRRLMRLHYLSGDRAAAQEAYWRVHALLRDELGVRPSGETQQLAQTLEAAGASPVPLPNRPVPASLLRPPLLIGRHGPWTEMVGAWERQQPFVLVGEAGLGKSRLLEVFAHDRDGLLADRARPGDDQSSDALLGRLLLMVEQRFAPRCSAPQRAELARVQPALGERPATPANLAVVRHAIEDWLSDALTRGLRAIVVDDLHNADRGSLETLRWLTASPALSALRLGFASRPWSEQGVGVVLQEWLSDSQRPTRIDLKPLTPSELRELLASLALPTLLDDRVAVHLYRHAGGHPLYTLATLQDAVVRGVGLQHAGALQQLPAVNALLDARVRDLPGHTRELLQVAAVGGADLNVERAARLLARAPLDLTDTWAQLEASNVLRGEAFSHDLVHEAALRSVPQGFRQALHRRWAALLEDEDGALPARIAEHWERGLRWSEAGRAWHRAAQAARLAGQLAEQSALLESAARCHREAGDRTACFTALLARLECLHLRQGGAAVLAALPEVELLADTSAQRVSCRIERIEALLEQGRALDAAVDAQRALDEAAAHADLALRVHCQLAIALAQSRRTEAALVQATQAVQTARARGDPQLALKAFNAQMYVHWSVGRLADAVAVQREELACAEALGDRTLMVASRISLAALLAGVGDVRATYDQASSARKQQADLGLANNSTPFVLNSTVLGAAAAALGNFDEALAALQEAVDRAGPEAAAAVRAKALIALAGVWLQLGRADRARALALQVPAMGVPPGMQLQALWLLARAAELDRTSPRPYWQRFDTLVTAHADLPVVLGVDFEVSYREEAPAAIERLQRARAELLALGMHGTARTLAWRELARWLEVRGRAATEAALALARSLDEHVAGGLSARGYLPEVLLDLARAFERGGEDERRIACVRVARQWVDAASVRMAPTLRHAFAQANAVNRAVLAWQC
ncbi:MAG: AAA family ATPase [Burkholderiales bacterium]|nr:AAA family ATPase [Burkholderiales bacterium]